MSDGFWSDDTPHKDDCMCSECVETYLRDRISALEEELTKERFMHGQLINSKDDLMQTWNALTQITEKGKDRIAALEEAIGNYLSAIADRESWAYPEPDERIRLARAIDDTQAAMFALLKEQRE